MIVHARPVQGYFLQPYERLPKELPSHWLGNDGAELASCLECDQLLTCLLSLDVADPRLELQAFPTARLNLQVCAACKRSSLSVTSAGELISLRAAEDALAVPGRNLQPPTFAPVALHAIPDRVAEAQTLAGEGRIDEAGEWVKAFDWLAAAHQIGGQPAWAGTAVPNVSCPLCSSPLPFFASLACETTSDIAAEETAPAQVLFFICRSCFAVVSKTAFHRNP